MSLIKHFFKRAESVLARIEPWLPPSESKVKWEEADAWRWVKGKFYGQLVPIKQVDGIRLVDLHGIDQQKATILQNTQQFVAGFPANHVLLAGARGTGKSSLVKALLNELSEQGLRLIEVDKSDLLDLLSITKALQTRSEHFIIYCDDLSFEVNDPAYKALKVVLDGSAEVTSDNVLVYATSNRRNLMPELMSDNLLSVGDEEVRPNDTIEEKTSLSERFGLRLMFHTCDQETYLSIAEQWVSAYGVNTFNEEARQAALLWSYTRGARSGRIANQFAKDYAGKILFANAQAEVAE